MKLSFKKTAAMTLVVAFSIIGISTANAVTCSLNLEGAYQEAIKRGWTFKCESHASTTSSFNFDSEKRPGCTGHTGTLPQSYGFDARFFTKGNAVTSAFANGWKLESFQVTGGQHQQFHHIGGVRVGYYWTTNQLNIYTKRYLSELKLSKDNGNCAKVYAEAFGG